MEFHMLLFFFFFKYSHDLSTDLSKTLLFKASFLFKASLLFQHLFPFFMHTHIFHVSFTRFSVLFFNFFILYTFTIYCTLPLILTLTHAMSLCRHPSRET